MRNRVNRMDFRVHHRCSVPKKRSWAAGDVEPSSAELPKQFQSVDGETGCTDPVPEHRDVNDSRFVF
jgi:hypothetical protein